jgi:flavoprotein
MKTKSKLVVVFLLILITQSCIVTSPKYTTIDEVVQIEIGMSLSELEKLLEIPVYDLYHINENGEKIIVFNYRVFDRKVPLKIMTPNNGKKTLGKYDKLIITLSKDNKVIKVESTSAIEKLKNEDTKNKKRYVD